MAEDFFFGPLFRRRAGGCVGVVEFYEQAFCLRDGAAEIRGDGRKGIRQGLNSSQKAATQAAACPVSGELQLPRIQGSNPSNPHVFNIPSDQSQIVV